MHVWIDIENPPQVQYLLPFAAAMQAAGAAVSVTARDYGITYDLLEERGVEFARIGSQHGAGNVRKVAGALGRARELRRLFRPRPRPGALISAGRGAVLAASAACASPRSCSATTSTRTRGLPADRLLRAVSGRDRSFGAACDAASRSAA